MRCKPGQHLLVRATIGRTRCGRHRASGDRRHDRSARRRAAPSPARAAASQLTERISKFSATRCKALWRCAEWREPFEYCKCL
jgi:ring-1,2-phenylacetyl-CoA epoxidase subunit PaaD